MPITRFSTADIRRLLSNRSALELSDGAELRLKWFLYCATHDGNVSLTCRHFGISRSTFLRWADRFDPADLSCLEEQSRAPHVVRAPETDPMVVQWIRAIRMQDPLLGKERITHVLHERHGVSVSSSTVGRVIKRHGLFFGKTVAHQSKRLKTDEASTALPGAITPLRARPIEHEPETDAGDFSLVPHSGLTQ